MKIIFSRKGFDSQYGRIPNPILPDGRLLMLPIPDRDSPIRFEDVRLNIDGYTNIYEVIRDLAGTIKPGHRTHLDPDLCVESLPGRAAGWRPVLGQIGAALGHLRNQQVGFGDLFLFFGRFRRTILADGKLRYDPGAVIQHVLFGWLQIAEIVDFNQAVPSWLSYHPHAVKHGPRNYGFIATEELNLWGDRLPLPGGGVFAFDPRLVLTKPHQPKHLVSLWELPSWFYPDERRPPLSRHERRSRWELTDTGHVELMAVARGQEFVLHADSYPLESVRCWLHALFRV